MRGVLLAAIALVLAASLFQEGYASTGDPEYICADDTMIVTFANPTNQVWRIVFVRFPQDGEAGRTDYSDAAHLESELEDYISVMSRGIVTADVEIVLDPENETQPWTADSAAGGPDPHGEGCHRAVTVTRGGGLPCAGSRSPRC